MTLRICIRVVQLSALLGDDYKKHANAAVTRLHSLLTQDMTTKAPPSPMFYYVLVTTIDGLMTATRAGFNRVSRALLAFVQQLLPLCRGEMLQYLRAQNTAAEHIEEFLQGMESAEPEAVVRRLETFPAWIIAITWARTSAESDAESFRAQAAITQGIKSKGDQAAAEHAQKMTEQFANISCSGQDRLDEDWERLAPQEIKRLAGVCQQLHEIQANGAYQWRRVMRTLKSGRGPWGTAEAVVNWKLDKTENYSRMRLKMCRNHTFDHHDGAAVNYGTSSPPPEPQETPLQSLAFPKGVQEEIDEEPSPEPVSAPPATGDAAGAASVEKLLLETECELIGPLKLVHGTL
jgi:hypothetical protein